MSRLSNILLKPKEVEFRGEKYILHGLKGDKMHLFMEDSSDVSPEEIQEKMYNIIFYTLKPSIEDLTMEEVKALDIEALNFFMEHMQELNNINPDTASKKAADLVKERIQNVKKIKAEQPKGQDIQQEETKQS